MNDYEHKLDSRLTLVIVYIMAIFNGVAYHHITTQQSVENLGTFLVTKFNENEKSCPRDIMANGEKVYKGAVAISPDIRDNGILMFGDKIYIDEYGEFEVACLTHKRHKRLIDIYTTDLKEAKMHGAKRKRVYLIKENF